MRPIDYFDTAAERYRDYPALIDDDVTLSFADLARLSHRIASALRSVVGDSTPVPVGILAPNDYRVMVCTVGIMRAGAVVMSMHVRNGVERNARFLDQMRPACVFYHSSVRQDVDAIRRQAMTSTRWVCLDSDVGEDASLEQFIAGHDWYIDRWGDVFGNPTRPVYIRQTSGTTGTPKAIVGDIGSYAATHNALQYKLHVDGCDPVCLVPMPLSHAAGVHAFAMLTLGASLVIMRDFDPPQVLRQIQRHHVTHIWLAPSALYLLLSCPDLENTDHSSLRSIVLGTAAVSPERLREAVQIFGPCVAVNYAQIEGGFLTWFDTAAVGAAVAGDHPERLASSGMSLFVSRVAVMGDSGELLPAGKTGEVVVRGRTVKPYIVKPYVEDVDELATSRRNGWHLTGDIGYLDDSGYLFLVGRKKDTVNTAGFKVSAAEVEQVIMELTPVAECAVIGVPDGARGEAVKAVVTLRGGRTITDREILTHCRQRLGRLHSPSSIEYWPTLPKNAVGKIDKHTIRERCVTSAGQTVRLDEPTSTEAGRESR